MVKNPLTSQDELSVYYRIISPILNDPIQEGRTLYEGSYERFELC